MKQRKKTRQIQTELIFELRAVGDPILLKLPADRQVELETLIAELLLNVVPDNVEVLRGVEHDA